MGIILFDGDAHNALLPLTYTRPVADLRIGILTIAGKWGKYFDLDHSFHTQNYLQQKYPLKPEERNLLINGAVCPDLALKEAIMKLHGSEALIKDGRLIAVKLNESDTRAFNANDLAAYKQVNYTHGLTVINHPEDIFKFNDAELRNDFALLTKGRKSAAISPTNTIIGDDFFAEEGVLSECNTFNTTNGPIYLSAGSEIWEGTHIRGAFAIHGNSQVKMGSKIYGATTIGPYCRVGGEINNAVIWGYSNKGHEGYLGNAVIGEWCNIGADSNNSNLKNNYSEVKLWDHPAQGYRNTGLMFCGLIMADHAKCGINTMFNTGTVVGVSANVFGGGYPSTYIPDFTWGGTAGLEAYAYDKMMETAGRVIARRPHRAFDDTEIAILKKVYELTRAVKK